MHFVGRKKIMSGTRQGGAGGAVGLVARLRRVAAALLGSRGRQASASWLQDIGWREFLLLVGDAFRLQDWAVSEQGAGADLVLRRGGSTALVQCKHWKAINVDADVVRDLHASMAAQGADAGFVLTAGNFSAQARAFAQSRNIQLVDGPMLVSMVRQAQATRMAETAPAPLDARPR
jgi:restriction system protein